MPEIGLQRARVVPLVGQRIAAGVPQHVRVRLEAKLASLPARSTMRAKPAGGERCAPLGGEHEGRLRLLLALEPPQSAQLVAEDWMGAGVPCLTLRTCRVAVSKST